MKVANKTLHYLIAIFFLYSLSFVSAATSLYVFFPTEVRPQILQHNFTKICPDIETIVFGRINDYLEKLTKTPPDAIISLPPVIEKKSNYKTLLQGQKNGLTNDKYVLVSIGSTIKISEISEIKIGAIDILGRKPMKKYISHLLGSKIKLKRVTKIEDILPLLTFNLVKAVFITENLFEHLKQTSKQNLVSTRLNIKLGKISAAINIRQDKTTQLKITQCISRLDDTTNKLLGVDQWK